MPTIVNQRFWVTVAVCAISVALELYGRACGFNLTSDSIQYLSSAKSFQLEGKFLGEDGTYNPYWPPLFPILLSFFSNPLLFLGWLNVISKIILAGVILFLSNRFLKSNFYGALFIISSLLSVYVMMISVFVWTELFFMALIFLNTYFALNRTKRFYFAGLLVTGFLVCLQRNAGLFWVVGVSVWMVLPDEESIKNSLPRALLFFLISTSGLWAWNIYNTYFLPADFAFYDRPFFEGFFTNIALMMGAFAKMVAPASTITFQFLVFVPMAFFVLYYAKPLSKNLFLIITVVYVAGFTVLGTLDAYELDRYLSVITPFIFLLMLHTAEKISKGAMPWVRYGVMACAILWMTYTLTRTAKNVQFWHERSCLTESSR